MRTDGELLRHSSNAYSVKAKRPAANRSPSRGSHERQRETESAPSNNVRTALQTICIVDPHVDACSIGKIMLLREMAAATPAPASEDTLDLIPIPRKVLVDMTKEINRLSELAAPASERELRELVAKWRIGYMMNITRTLEFTR